jgi:DNA-binding NtrC family response regulator
MLDSPSAELPLDLERLEEWAIRKALQRTNGNLSAAARLVGLSRETLGVKCKKYEIDVHALRGRDEH